MYDQDRDGAGGFTWDPPTPTPQQPTQNMGTPPPWITDAQPQGIDWATFNGGNARDPQGNMWTWDGSKWTQQAAPQAPITSGPSGNGGADYSGGLPQPFSSPFTAPSPVNLGGPSGIPYIPPTPQFNAPQQRQMPAFQGPAPFQAPSMQDVLNDPGYQFPLQQGLGAMSNSKAAQGLWATGGTGKAFNDYAQNYANQFYGNIYNRDLNTYQTNYGNALNAYNTNYGTQVKDPNNYDYTAALAQFAPQMTGYQTQASAGQHQNDMNYQNAYQKWLDDYNQKKGTAQFLFDTTSA